MADKDNSGIPSLSDHHYFTFFKEFDISGAADVVEFILARNLMTVDRPKFIKALINSPGGDIAAAFSIIDTMKGKIGRAHV